MKTADRILFVPGYWNMTSPVMIARLLGAHDLWQHSEWPYSRIIVSGGITKPGQRESEAEFMKKLLVASTGIDPENIIAECFSRDSFESVRNVVEWYLRNPMHFPEKVDVTVVSQLEHAIRLKISFEAHGFRARIIPVPGYSLRQRVLAWGYILYTLFDPKGENWFSKWKAGRAAKMPRWA